MKPPHCGVLNIYILDFILCWLLQNLIITIIGPFQLPPPESWGCSQINTRIRYQGTSTEVPSRGHEDVPATENTLILQNHTVSGLPPCIEYNIQLLLFSQSGGFGPLSSLTAVDVGGEGMSRDLFLSNIIRSLLKH